MMRGGEGRLRRLWVALVVLLALSVPAVAQDHPLRGVALVIGESGYTGLHPLANPKSDARAMDDLLDELGFSVERVLDGDGNKLRESIADFVAAAKDADVALVYYSGHGIEVGGANYLVPVDADLSTPKTAGASLVPVKDLLDGLTKVVPVTIVLLDACRTDAFPPGTLIQLPGTDTPVAAVETGLGEERGPQPLAKPGVAEDSLGMVIGFAASPGQPALDGAPGEDNSPYAAALLKHLAAGGYSFGDVMTMVSEEVYLKTRAKQLPWVNSSLRRVLNFGKPVEPASGDDAAIRQGRRQLLLTIASAPPATRAYVETVAKAEGVPLDALYGMLKVLGVDTSGGAADLEKQLQQGAQQLKLFMEQKLGGVKSDADLNRLAGLADEAQGEGAMDLALKFREQATARARELSQSRDQLEGELKSDRLEIGATFGEHAQTASLNFEFDTAAKMFGEAYAQVARWDDDAALEYKRGEADALRSYGEFKGDNDALKQALISYQEALQLAPRETRLADWVSIENNLGWALMTLGGRETDTAHLEQGVAVLQAALDAYPRDQSPLDWGVTKMNLASTLSTLGERDGDTARFEAAAVAFREALAATPREQDPLLWSSIEVNLASTLRNLGERKTDRAILRESIATFEAGLGTLTRELSPLDWAFAQNNYGVALFSLGTMTHDLATLQQAAAAFDNALLERSRDRVPLDWAMSESNRGNVMATIAQQTGDMGALQQAIGSYRQALEVLTPETVPLLWATGQSNLGVALTTLGETIGDPNALQMALEAFKASLTVRTRQNDAINWAMTELNLAAILQDLGLRNGDAAQLEAAVEASKAAMTEWTRERAPENWARAQFNLGLSLYGIAGLEQGTERLDEAIVAYRSALEVFSNEVNPVEWENAQEHLGLALQTLGEREDGSDNSRAAIEAYERALTGVTPQTNPGAWTRVNFNIGLTWQTLDAKGDTDALTKAAAAYRQALLATSREVFPADWGDTQYNLGLVLHGIASQGTGITDVLDAIAAYRAALEVKTREADPIQWAMAENYLGQALGLLGQRTHDKAAVEEGRDAVAAAWEVYKGQPGYDADFEQRLAMFDDLLAQL
jgi:uncharacterized caspase-like protein